MTPSEGTQALARLTDGAPAEQRKKTDAHSLWGAHSIAAHLLLSFSTTAAERKDSTHLWNGTTVLENTINAFGQQNNDSELRSV